MKSQNQKILKHLQSGKSITPIEALNKYGCFRLGARIYDLKKDVWKIESELITKKGKSFSCYRLKNAIR